MPSGRIHAVTTMALTLGISYIAYQQGYAVPSVVALGGGSLSGLLLSPDLDVDGGSISNKFARRAGGCLFGLLWSILWQPYAMLVPHRSWISHCPILSTVIRLGYLSLPLIIYQWFTYHQISLLLPGWWYLAFTGLCLADLLHIGLDLITTPRRRHHAKRY